ncbi:S9 family peptidase [Hymenobacter busanensis]|uniref:S9 family peptidase n=1 Tax=Hymenobacter busanensis TaxID=2607656 RepID=A0A7L4ZWL7_9BACT|nr:prolyl oligopeptidase family serine peptidase [Hymenobacter busanensis]KAA9332041.1 S9 family peptidase [Hymenobacter busanensis]QHJ07621.1 prolyl oligopeptidase family serine peptidase [Hymenobacter busanensis]
MKKHVLLGLMWVASLVAVGQDVPYQTPPKAIADWVDAPQTPRVNLSSDGKWMLLLPMQDMPSIADLSQPEFRLAGLRINPRTNGPSRVSFATGMMLRRVEDGKDLAVLGLPQQARISDVTWSPDNSKIALTLTSAAAEGRIELWVVDLATVSAKRLAGVTLNSVFGKPYEWVSDNETLIVRGLVAGRGAAPSATAAPTGPAVQESTGKKSGARTYQDLLKSPTDERLFEHFATSQLVKITVGGKVQPLGQPAIIQSAEPSPNGKYVLVKTRHRPFSYTLPVSSFPLKVDVIDLVTGDLVKTLDDLPLADNVPTSFDAVPTGARAHDWRADAPATLYWVEAQDGGDPKATAAVRDKIFTLPAPFSGKAEELAALPLRFDDIIWGNNNIALVSTSRWADRKEVTYTVSPGALPSLAMLFDRSAQDKYHAPGTPYTKRNAQGQYVLATDSKSQTIYLIGAGASPEGDRPFVDELDVKTKVSKRWWRSEAPFYEVPLAILDFDKQRLLTRRESVDQAPNYYLRDARSGKLTALTKFPNPYGAAGAPKKQVLHYKRADGVDLTANLYLPANHKPGDAPLPTLMEAYPVEFKDKKNAGQVSGSPYTFTRVGYGSPIFWVTQGYAVLQGASIPIVGEGDKEPNDTYTEQLVASAKAAIDEGKRLGVVDPSRVAVMGHSYGAFMTANLLAHSDLFKAGIARSGAYNRTLTPFGFQGEERTYWEAPEVYNAMSPFNFANKIKTPILLIHGELDNNSGTFPIQTERFYNALKGHGATARYVVLPAESHGYAARENIMHMLWEMNAWLDKYVKMPAATSANAAN